MNTKMNSKATNQGQLNQVRAALETEMNLKNEAYLFILQSGNFENYREWTKQRHADGRTAATAHAECVLTLAMAADPQLVH
jgi:hypothetical protein